MKHAAQIWIGSYLEQQLAYLLKGAKRRVKTAYIALVDHYEPYWGQASDDLASQRVSAWEEGWPKLCGQFCDSRGRPPQHTFFYPLEDYRPGILDRLAGLCGKGLGEVEVHFHHHGESSAQMEDILSQYAQTLYQKHGQLRLDPASGKPTYGFVHGNWALDNARPDGRWCGVNDELLVLKKSGCYADFTLPAAPDPSQTSTINSIYYATDDPRRPKSHDTGVAAKVGQAPVGDLLLVQGVLALDWGRRKYGLFPHLENSDLAGYQPPHPARVPIWLKFAPRVQGADDICFIKLHCHGAVERNQDALMGEPMRNLLNYLINRCPEELGCEFRFVTCWEMVQIIHALERGEELLQ